MVLIANVQTSDTFGTWRTRTNQAFGEIHSLATPGASDTLVANTLTATINATFSGVANFGNTTLITFPAVGNLNIPGGSSGNHLQTDGSGTITWAAPTASFGGLSGVIANTQFPGTLGVSSNTTFSGNVVHSGANATFSGSHVNLGAVGDVSISGGTTGYPLKTDGSGTLSWGTLGNTAIAAGAVDSAALAAGAVTFYKLPKNLVVTTTAGSNNVMLSPGALVLANTRGGSHYVALNANPTNGDEIRIHDSEGCWAGNNLIVNSNSKTIMGTANFTGDVSNGFFTLVYSSTINDWRVINYG